MADIFFQCQNFAPHGYLVALTLKMMFEVVGRERSRRRIGFYRLSCMVLVWHYLIQEKAITKKIIKGTVSRLAHARASSVFSPKDNRTVILTRQDFLPDLAADGDLLFIFSSNVLDFRRSLSSHIKIWLAVRRLIAILSLAGPPRDPKISFRSL